MHVVDSSLQLSLHLIVVTHLLYKYFKELTKTEERSTKLIKASENSCESKKNLKAGILE